MAKKGRGTRTHGKGSQKKGRGAGNRGGRGKAGRWKHERYPNERKGKYGFKRPECLQEDVSIVNVGELDESIDQLVDEGYAQETETGYRLDLGDMGVDKLLGSGRVTTELVIDVEDASDSAVTKVQDAGGDVTA